MKPGLIIFIHISPCPFSHMAHDPHNFPKYQLFRAKGKMRINRDIIVSQAEKWGDIAMLGGLCAV